MDDTSGLVDGIRPRVHEVKINVAQATLAVRRGDAHAAEVYLRNAQRTLVAIELGLPAP
jgi:hypothetical protein